MYELTRFLILIPVAALLFGPMGCSGGQESNEDMVIEMDMEDMKRDANESSDSDDFGTLQDSGGADASGADLGSNDQGADPEHMAINYLDVEFPKNCQDICAENGLSCDGMFMHALLGRVGGSAFYSGGSGVGLNCETVPEATREPFIIDENSDMEPELEELEKIRCYCT